MRRLRDWWHYWQLKRRYGWGSAAVLGEYGWCLVSLTTNVYSLPITLDLRFYPQAGVPAIELSLDWEELCGFIALLEEARFGRYHAPDSLVFDSDFEMWHVETMPLDEEEAFALMITGQYGVHAHVPFTESPRKDLGILIMMLRSGLDHLPKEER